MLDGIRDRLRPLKSWIFPYQVLLELSDNQLLGQPIFKGRPGPICLDVPLPALTIKEGVPVEVEPLADLIGELMVRENLIDAYVMASLPEAAVHWRVLEWETPLAPGVEALAALREREPNLGLPFPLAEAELDLQALPLAPGQWLLAATRREVVEGWITVFHQAGLNLDRLTSPQSCRLAALHEELAAVPSDTLVLVVSPGDGQDRGPLLLAIQDGVPLFERPMPVHSAAAVAEMARSMAFLREAFPSGGGARLLLDPAFKEEEQAELEDGLSLLAERIACSPYGSLVMKGLAIPELVP
ncbi:MAG: hypothetical protein ACK5QW_03235 [Cyanobacteriota bacterium]